MAKRAAKERLIERFKKRTIWFHWIHTLCFLILFITGIFLFVPGWGIVAQDGITRVVHRIAAVIFVTGPIIYFTFNAKMSLHFLKETSSWGKDDIEWFKAAPAYYFGGSEDGMPPQGDVNTGQKIWQFVVLVTGVMFIVTGIIMWFFKGIVGPGVFRWSVIVHDVAFLVSGLMLMVHIYLGIVHPRMSESLRSMWTGKISEDYAKTHYGKWYEEISKLEVLRE